MNENRPDNKTELKFKKWIKIKLFERLSHTKGRESDTQSNQNLNKYKNQNTFQPNFSFFVSIRLMAKCMETHSDNVSVRIFSMKLNALKQSKSILLLFYAVSTPTTDEIIACIYHWVSNRQN